MEGPKAAYVEEMFDSIAPEYDRLNHILSLNADKIWRRRSIKQLISVTKPQKVLDIACGTGDFSLQIAVQSHPDTLVTGLDLSRGMLDVMEKKISVAGLSNKVKTIQGNCETLPFDDNVFDVVTIAFGIRNVERRKAALTEILRVLRPGGTLLILELSVPTFPIIRQLYKFYFLNVLPYIGGKISGRKDAYKYLPASVMQFPRPDEWTETMRECGYISVKYKALTFGICSKYLGSKRDDI